MSTAEVPAEPEPVPTDPPDATMDRDQERARIARAESTVRQHMQLALAVGLVPIPLVDFTAVAALQLRLLRDLAALYDVEFSTQRGKAAIAALAGGASSTLASVGLRRLVPQLIGLPLLVACATGTAAFAGASTFAIGRVFTQHFASGGTFLTFDPERVRAFYAEALAQGREEVQASFVGVKP